MAEQPPSAERRGPSPPRWDADLKKRGFIAGRHWSIRCALLGFLYVCRTQRNAWVHLAATAIVVAAGLFVRLALAEWLWIAAAIGAVWIAELFNTAIEFLCDALRAQFDPQIGRVKDVAAAAVLMTAFIAAIIGTIIFWPHLAHIVTGGAH